jgi:hypothetical protein
LLVIAHVLAQPPRARRTLPPQFEVIENQLPDAKVQNALTNLLMAIENDDYELFVGELTINFRANVDEVLFKQIHESIGNRMAPNYRVVYMGELNKPGFKTFVYKLVFKDKAGEVLTTLSFNADAQGNIVEADKEKLKVAGFYLH